MASLEQLAERLTALVQGVRASWSDQEITIARDAWSRYDRARLKITAPLEGDVAGYVALRTSGVTVPRNELATKVDRISRDVDDVIDVLDRTEDDLYDVIGDLNRDAVEIVDARRMSISELRGGLERWCAELRAEARVTELSAAAETGDEETKTDVDGGTTAGETKTDVDEGTTAGETKTTADEETKTTDEGAVTTADEEPKAPTDDDTPEPPKASSDESGTKEPEPEPDGTARSEDEASPTPSPGPTSDGGLGADPAVAAAMGPVIYGG